MKLVVVRKEPVEGSFPVWDKQGNLSYTAKKMVQVEFSPVPPVTGKKGAEKHPDSVNHAKFPSGTVIVGTYDKAYAAKFKVGAKFTLDLKPTK